MLYITAQRWQIMFHPFNCKLSIKQRITDEDKCAQDELTDFLFGLCPSAQAQINSCVIPVQR